MKTFDSHFLAHYRADHNILKTIRIIGEFRGKEALFRMQSPQTLATLRESAVIQSTESSNRIEGITVRDQERLKSLLQSQTQPLDRSEQEIAGYRDVLNNIHMAHESIPFTPNIVLQFHRDVFRYTNEPGGRWKSVDNTIEEQNADGSRSLRFRPLAAWQTADAMNRLHDFYTRDTAPPVAIDPLIAIPAYVLDFLCIHPFRDGNGRISRLLSLLLLYKAGYSVGRFISLERVIEDTKDSYYDSLLKSSQGWHEGTHNITPWLEYFLGVMLMTAYREFESRVGLTGSARGTKTAMVLSAIDRAPQSFTISDILDRCPTVGVDHVRKTLRNERDAGKLRSEGLGPKARWVKCT